MSLTKFVFLFIIIFFSCFGNVLLGQQSSQIQLEGDWIDFNQLENEVQASGNVRFHYNDVKLKASSFHYLYDEQALSIDDRFLMTSGDYYFYGSDFRFQKKENSGYTRDVNAKVDRFYIKGEELIISGNTMVINHASFTTCELDHPHYQILTDKIIVYPQYGFFVALQNQFSTRYLPFNLWIPTYFYGSSAYSLLGEYSPIPRFGQTRREGVYVKHSVPYFINEKSRGKADFGYLWNLGTYLGVSHGYTINSKNRFRLSLHSNGSDGLSGGGVYFYDLKRKKLASVAPNLLDSLFSEFSPDLNLPLAQIRLQMTYNQLISDSRVDSLPVVHLDFPLINLPYGLDLTAKTNHGKIRENTLDGRNIEAERTIVNLQANHQFSLHDSWTFNPFFNYITHMHKDFEDWNRAFGGVKVSWDWKLLNPAVTYSKRLSDSDEGSSPFEYVQKYAQLHDELAWELSHKFKRITLASYFAYDLESERYRKQDYQIGFPLHRFTLFLTFKSVEGYFQFGGTI